MRKLVKNSARELTLVLAIVLMGVIFTIIEPTYVTSKNLMNILDQSTINGLLALGVTFAILTGGIDLSIGAILGLVVVMVGQWLVDGMNVVVGVLVGIGLGFVFGCGNGLLITQLKLQPFIATLGTCSVFRGIAYIITGGWPVMNIPDKFRKLVDGDIGFLPIALLIMLVFLIVGYILLRKTRFGLYIYSIGNNEEATRLSGVNISFNKTLAYGICGVGAALAGLVMVARLGSGEPSAGTGYELNAIAAAAIGGTSLAGGKGNIFGTLLGAVLLQALKTGLVVVSVDPYFQYVATGVIIIIAASFETVRTSIAGRKKKIVVRQTQ